MRKLIPIPAPIKTPAAVPGRPDSRAEKTPPAEADQPTQSAYRPCRSARVDSLASKSAAPDGRVRATGSGKCPSSRNAMLH